MPYDSRLREEDLKNKVARDWFDGFDWTPVVGNIDFCIEDSEYNIAYLWAEAKKGTGEDIYASFVQLIITIGKARAFEKRIPPAFLGAFDAEKIAFLPYHAVMAVFSQNDFNWNVTPSDHTTKEFKQLYDQVKEAIEANSLMFEFQPKDKKRLRAFIKANFKPGVVDPEKIEITRNNFSAVYFRWVEAVRPSITVNWEATKAAGIIDADFYLADLLSEDNLTIKEKLYVLLKTSYYEFARQPDADLGYDRFASAGFRDGQKAHAAFWKQYKRPPREEFWDYIIEHRDFLVPQDVRERKGSYFTPRQWVELSQDYIARALGKNWQSEYYVWDCAAGTGNLLAGLTEPERVWASTIDQADVNVMKDRIDNGANLLPGNVFQFDFLNDGFDKLPANLHAIVKDPERRKKLVVYINPPYAEAGNRRQVQGTGKNKAGVAASAIYDKYQPLAGTAMRELSAQFMLRVSMEIPGCRLANFSKIKALQADNFIKFRTVFPAVLDSLFLVKANTFDNVSGSFPIGFHIWDTTKKRKKQGEIITVADVYGANGRLSGQKTLYNYDMVKSLVPWQRKFYDRENEPIAMICLYAPDVQNSKRVFISLRMPDNVVKKKMCANVTRSNLSGFAIYNAIRHVIESTWLNDRDLFLYPASTWETDVQFQNDCLAWTLFNTNISVAHGVNHWIPFTAREAGAKAAFTSTFMTDYIAGKLKPARANGFFDGQSSVPSAPLEFSPAAQAVFAAGLTLWRYYHRQPNANPNAALYDIKAHFQGRNAKGKMNSKSGDETYNDLMADLRAALKALAGQIKPKVYEHGFLRA